jgi:hypothetical protein
MNHFKIFFFFLNNKIFYTLISLNSKHSTTTVQIIIELLEVVKIKIISQYKK